MTSTEQWNAVPGQVRHLFIKYAATAQDLIKDHEDDLQDCYIDTPEVGRLYMAKYAQQESKPFLHKLFGAHRGVQDTLGKALGMGGATPLTAALVSGALGAGVGYGGGWLAQKLFPRKYMRRGPLARNMAIAGGLLGAGVHGGSWILPQVKDRLAEGQGFFSSLWNAAKDPGAYGDLNKLRGTGRALPDWKDRVGTKRYGPLGTNITPDTRHMPEMVIPQVDYRGAVEKTSTAAILAHAETQFNVEPTVAESLEKIGFDFSTNAFVPRIPVNAFNQIVFNDPNTPPPIQAATAGLTTAASMRRGGANMISPFDVGRIAVGMGTGAVSGMLVGKTLGALAGLTPEAQQGIVRGGVMAGLLTNIVPMAFRG